MRTWVIAASLMPLLLAPGCSCGQRAVLGGARDGASGPGDGGPGDGGRGDSGWPDVSVPWDAGTCGEAEHWLLVPRPIVAIGLIDVTPPRVGASERLRVVVQLDSLCEQVARVDVTVSPGDATDGVGLRAWAWTLTSCVTDAAPSEEWIVVVPGREQDNFSVFAYDEASPLGVGFSYGREACTAGPACFCPVDAPPGPVPEGGDCVTDCGCAAGLACVCFPGSGVPRLGCRCLRPCNDLLDCAPGEGCPAAPPFPRPAFVCDTAAAPCAADGVCPDGFVCVDGACLDGREPPTREPCACDAQCPPGQRCTDAFDGQPRCETWCHGDASCGPASLTCHPAGVCLPYER